MTRNITVAMQAAKQALRVHSFDCVASESKVASKQRLKKKKEKNMWRWFFIVTIALPSSRMVVFRIRMLAYTFLTYKDKARL